MRAAVCIVSVLLTLCLGFFVQPSFAQDSRRDQDSIREGKQYCIKCHGMKNSVKKFSDGDFVSTYIDLKTMDASAHRSLSCTACHKEFTDLRHPSRVFKSKLQYRTKESLGCRDCHPEKTIKSRGIHEPLLKKEKAGQALVCTDCHTAHAVMPITAGIISTSEEKYCLNCHAKEDHMVFKSGESLSIRVHVTEIKNSPHRNVSCSDCHFGFSADEHPQRRFRSEREYRIASAEICRRCHFDKYSMVSEGIHYAMINVGRLEAPTCVDCHGGHSVSSVGNNRLSVVQKCKTCHSRAFDVYAKSVHGKALFQEDNRDVPICIDCHLSHSIKNPLSGDFHDYIPDMCSKCHSNKALMAKYGLSTEVVKSYLSDFHGMTLGLYRKEVPKRSRPDRPMAVCTDCHGTHEIASVSGVGVQAMKRNLLKRCQTCHSDATENFPQAWLSHYKPTLAAAPLVFIVEQFYKIMMPLMVAGMLFQVFLHIWRYLINRSGPK